LSSTYCTSTKIQLLFLKPMLMLADCCFYNKKIVVAATAGINAKITAVSITVVSSPDDLHFCWCISKNVLLIVVVSITACCTSITCKSHYCCFFYNKILFVISLSFTAYSKSLLQLLLLNHQTIVPSLKYLSWLLLLGVSSKCYCRP